MKIDSRAIDGFLRNPRDAVRVAVFHGPDQGLVAERSARLGSSVVDDLKDPFAVVDLTEADLKEDPPRLGDEARALSFGGGHRLVRVRGSGEPVAKAVALYLADPGPGALVIVEAGELSPKSGLRANYEKNPTVAVIGCYPDQGSDLAATVRRALADRGLNADREAVERLCVHLAEDRGVVRSEIEKLVLYVGDGNRVSVADVSACLTDAAAVSLDGLALACADGDTGAVDRLTRRALDEGMSEIALIRATQQHFLRLEWVVAQGEGALSRLRPPVFFKQRDRVQAQVRRWSSAAIRRAVAALTEAEIGCKSSGQPASLVCSRTLLAIASQAAGPRRHR